ncbi:MAG: electron transfer flavoprotein subunit beta/FixA family protein [Candidatus Helarchaeota archaeon]
MKIFVCIKQVPAIAEVKIDPKTGLLIREGVPSIINPVDKHALELALTIRDKTPCEIIAITMGPPQAEEALREALAMGFDKAYLLTDRAFAGADTLATSYTLAIAIKKILKESALTENFLIICGSQAIDGDTAQVGPELAEELNIPHMINVQEFDYINEKIIIESSLRPEELMILEIPLPALVTVAKSINTPRLPTLTGIVEAYDTKEVIRLTASDLHADKNKIGLTGSQTQVAKIFIPTQKNELITFSGSVSEMVKQLCRCLKEDKIL